MQYNIVSWLDLILIDEASADELFRLGKKEGTIQYGYRTWGTHARVFSQTLAHGNSKNDNETDEDTQKRGVSMEKSTAGTNKRSPDGLSPPNRNIIIINKI